MKAEAEKQDFEKGGGKSLEKLREKVLNGEVLNTAQQQLLVLVDLTEMEKQLEVLEADKGEHLKQVEKCQEALLPFITQPGNNFVTQALGT